MTAKNNFIATMKQKKDRYEMHKYWGKKPSQNLNLLIEKYSKIGDIVFDPFCGYGVFCSEAYILQRNVILNDLNPIANFIEEQLLEKDINLKKLESEFLVIQSKMQDFSNKWYSINIDGQIYEIISILRDKNDNILKCKYKSKSKKFIEYIFNEQEQEKFREFEQEYIIDNWFPTQQLIENSRISAKDKMMISDLFTKRTLANHAKLLNLIYQNSSGNEQKLLLVAFTSNLANCSKLVPPTPSRGDMAQGAWMTGFYIANKYIENNVLHYFKNRVKKIIKGKKDYLKSFKTLFTINKDIKKINDVKEFNNNTFGYYLLNEDAKKISLNNESIDYIFTDPPYGDTVPYFEQSIIWNSWLKKEPCYNEEIVISNSKSRKKDIEHYSNDIEKVIFEIYRVLKKEKFFSITFHSLSGLEWRAISNACLKAGFELYDFQWLTQKAFTPRQLNRSKTIKGDVLITFKKPLKQKKIIEVNKDEFKNIVIDKTIKLLEKNQNTTNIIFLELVKLIFIKKIYIPTVDILVILNENFIFENDVWSKK